MERQIELAIVDDDNLLVELLKGYFGKVPWINIFFTASSGNAFLRELDARETHPDVVLLDLKMEDGNGLDALKGLQERETQLKTIIFSSTFRLEYTGHLVKEGAHAYIGKSVKIDDLLGIVRKVFEFGHHWSREQMQVIQRQLSSKIPQVSCSPQEGLTRREREVLMLLCQQLSTQEIADHLYLSVKTIETYKSNLIVKTGVRNSLGLIVFAIQAQLVNPAEIVLLHR